MAHQHDATPPASLTTSTVDHTDVVEALVSPISPTAAAHPAAAGMHLRAIDPSDLALPAHHDTAIVDAAVRHLVARDDLILMDDFAGELRRWLTSPSR